MPQERLKIFVSAVTSEFGKARDALAADLRARHEVTIQSDFQQSPDSETLLGNLAEYIRDCHAVICLVGKRSGAYPPENAVERLPPGLLPAAVKEASYTQWEFFLARHFKRRPYVYIARDDFVADEKAGASDRPNQQSEYAKFLKDDGVQYGPFSNIDQLARAVFKDLPELTAKPIPRLQPTKPMVLPYPSIGELFKGRDEFMRRLHDSLTRSRAARTAIFSQALYGLGGIGKSRVAVEYAWAHADDYNALLFVVAPRDCAAAPPRFRRFPGHPCAFAGTSE
jgi:hypothetical protein